MKYFRTILALAVAMLVSASAFAASKSDADVEEYKTLITSSLRQEGFTPREDRDGDIEFSQEHRNYWIRVQAYDEGFYVSLFTLRNISAMDLVRVRRAMDETMADLLFVRMYTTSDAEQLIIQYNWYCTSAQDFKRSFRSAISVVSSANSLFTDNYVK